jgi:hypothetical protein
LTDQEVAAYGEAVASLLERQQQEAVKLVVGNYREYRALEAAIAVTWTTSSQPQRIDGSDRYSTSDAYCSTGLRASAYSTITRERV